MKELTEVLAAVGGAKAERLAAQKAFLRGRRAIWSTDTSANNKTFVGAPRRTAIRGDFLLASKAALGPKYAKDPLTDAAQRDLLFY